MNSIEASAKRFTAIFALMFLLGLGAQSAEAATHAPSAARSANSPAHDPEWG